MFKPALIGLICLTNISPHLALAEVGDVETVMLQRVSDNGTLSFSNGWAGRLWGVQPQAGFTDFMLDTFADHEWTCEHVGTISVRLNGFAKSDPVLLCAANGVLVSAAVVDEGVATEVCIETAGILGGRDTGVCLP